MLAMTIPPRQGTSNTLLEYSIECSCGRRLGVAAGMAGAEIACECGNKVAVPGLSQLRIGAGKEAYGNSALAQLRKMLANKPALPDGMCARCSRPAEGSIVFVVVCERPQASKRQWFRALLGLISLGVYLIAERMARDSDAEVQGRETVLRIPLTLCDQCRNKVTTAGPDSPTVRRLLRTTPVLSRLFDEYPDAEVDFIKS